MEKYEAERYDFIGRWRTNRKHLVKWKKEENALQESGSPWLRKREARWTGDKRAVRGIEGHETYLHQKPFITILSQYTWALYKKAVYNQYQTALICLLSSHKTFGKSNHALWSFPDEPWSFWPAEKQPFWILALICILSFPSNLIATAIADYIKIPSKIEYNFVTGKMQKYIFFFCLLLWESTDVFSIAWRNAFLSVLYQA